jgi:hypothetical protein
MFISSIASAWCNRGQNCSNPVYHIRRELSGIILLEKPFKPSVLEAHYHILIVARRASLVNIIGFNGSFPISGNKATL